jgi:nickel transport protein
MNAPVVFIRTIGFRRMKKGGDMTRLWTYLLISMAAALFFAQAASAHKVNLFAYVEGGTIYTECYFADGRPAEGGKVLVYDSEHKLLLEGVTNKEGLFSFAVPKVDDLTIVLEATMGHRASFTLKKAEVEAGK